MMWLIAFSLTLGLELLVAVPLLWRWLRPSTGGVIIRRVLLVNAVSHPVVWFLLPHLELEYVLFLAIAESWAFLSEALLYRLLWSKLGFRRAALLSLLANGASLGFGLLLQRTGWLF